MPRQFCPGIFWFRFAAVALRRIGAHSLMIHTLLSAVYLDLEFISSPAKLCKAQTDNRLHVVKAHFQYGIFSNACFLLCYLPLLVTNGSGSLSGCRRQQCEKKINIHCITTLFSSCCRDLQQGADGIDTTQTNSLDSRHHLYRIIESTD